MSTKIEWTRGDDGTPGETWNPLAGCRAVSSGCANCYAAKMTYRLEKMGQAKYAGLTVKQPNGKRHFNGIVRPDESALAIPLGWKKPRRVFVNSMSDLFYGDDADRAACEKSGVPFVPVPFEFIDKVFAVMNATAWQLPLPADVRKAKRLHTYQVLTKRTGRMAEYMQSRAQSKGGGEFPLFKVRGELFRGRGAELMNAAACIAWPPSNVWLGTSVENQKAADERILELQKCPAAVRFLSCEPLLGAVEIGLMGTVPREIRENYTMTYDMIDWVIVGGESGPGARAMHPDWARSIRDQCQAAGVPFFFKQWGDVGAGAFNMTTGEAVFRQFASKKQWINKASTWVNGGICIDASGRELKCGADFDSAAYPVTVMHRVGKKKAGRLLDGREWNEFPGAAVTTAEVAS